MRTLIAFTIAAGLGLSFAPAARAQTVLRGFYPNRAEESMLGANNGYDATARQAPVYSGRSIARSRDRGYGAPVQNSDSGLFDR